MRQDPLSALWGLLFFGACSSASGGRDAGTQTDAGAQTDAGVQTDAGAQADAGSSDKLLAFTAETGYRVFVDGGSAGIPSAGMDDAGTTYLYYEKDGNTLMSTSTDGLTFSAGTVATNYRYHQRYLFMPDGRWRTFMPSQDQATIISRSSADGTSPTADTGARYDGGPTDNSKFGIIDVYPDPATANKYIMIYLGDLAGKGNARRAVSTNGGNTFTFDRGNVLGDDACNMAQCRAVDQMSISLPTGERRLFAMFGGTTIDSFISDVNWDVFTKESGSRVTPTSFTSVGLTCYSLHDPSIVKLPDGRHRMYVTCRISQSGNDRGAIVSAVTAP